MLSTITRNKQKQRHHNNKKKIISIINREYLQSDTQIQSPNPRAKDKALRCYHFSWKGVQFANKFCIRLKYMIYTLMQMSYKPLVNRLLTTSPSVKAQLERFISTSYLNINLETILAMLQNTRKLRYCNFNYAISGKYKNLLTITHTITKYLKITSNPHHTLSNQ